MAQKRPARKPVPSPAAALAPFSSAQVEAELLRRKIAAALAPFSSAQVEAELLRRKIAGGEAVIAAHEEGLAVMRDKQARRRHELADRLARIEAAGA